MVGIRINYGSKTVNNGLMVDEDRKGNEILIINNKMCTFKELKSSANLQVEQSHVYITHFNKKYTCNKECQT
ncbi:hypothetical protein VNO77_05853 [Canavalia gladiata]|uniref:Uncharacterized protein n=1 Tax=Canavalia gladiata TaxID=3824 RepID=A0AAN9N152_CANGL